MDTSDPVVAGNGNNSVTNRAMSTQPAKVHASELFVQWMTLPDTQAFLEGLVAEISAAAKTPLDRSPSPPPSPPRSSLKLNKGDLENRTPSPVSRFALGVDEVDMANIRAHSPGAASPVSPTAVRHAVDPSLPHPAHDPSSSPRSSSLSLSSFDRVPPGKDPNAMSQSSHLSMSTQSLNVSFGSKQGAGTPQLLATPEDIPPFYQSNGAAPENASEIEALDLMFSIRNPRNRQPELDYQKTIKRAAFAKVCAVVFNIPSVLRDVAFRRVLAASGVSDTGQAATVNYEQIRRYYDVFMAKKKPSRRLFELIRRDNRREHITIDDLRGLARALVDFHPGLSFLTQGEFQDLYCQTVAVRIVHKWERNRSNVVKWFDFDRSDITEVLAAVDKSQDINNILCYFTYEHFYVLYCRFWELDSDRDYLIGFEDLQQYNQGAITNCVLHRVVAGWGRKLASGIAKKMNFEDFVHFCLNEEDKNNNQAVEYWFRVLDLDQDGVLSGWELQQLFLEQRERLLQMVGDELQFGDMLCQMIDMVGAKKLESARGGFTVGDLKSCPTVGHFFNMLFNAQKFMNFEHRDPFGEFHQKQQPEKTDWDRFARIEYDRMASEANQ